MSDVAETLLNRASLIKLLQRGHRTRQTLANKLNRSKRSISRHLKQLEDIGIITRRGSEIEMTQLGRWQAQILINWESFNTNIHAQFQGDTSIPTNTPPAWVLSTCTPLQATRQTPMHSLSALQTRLQKATNVKLIITHLTPHIEEIAQWDRTKTAISKELYSDITDLGRELEFNHTVIDSDGLSVNIFLAKTDTNTLTAFSFQSGNDFYHVLLSTDPDTAHWTAGWIHQHHVD